MYNLSSTDYFKFGKGMTNKNSDFRIISSHKIFKKKYDVLIFTDSKGSTLNSVEWKTWTELLIDQLEKHNLSFLFISRPKEITIFFTLITFLKSNPIRFNYLITNLGFVDFTPKKLEFMNDIIAQNPFPSNKNEYKFIGLGKYKLNSGDYAELYTFNYGNIEHKIAKELEKRFSYSLLLGCLEFSKDIKIKRDRPAKFFEQLKVSNNFIFNVSQSSNYIHYIQPLKYQFNKFSLLSYDAVHFTKEGHSNNFNIIKPFIDYYILRII